MLSAFALGRGLHRGLRRAALRSDRRGPRASGRRAVHARDVFCGSFTFGHVRANWTECLASHFQRGGGRWGPVRGDGRLVVDADSFVTEVFGPKKQGVGFG